MIDRLATILAAAAAEAPSAGEIPARLWLPVILVVGLFIALWLFLWLFPIKLWISAKLTHTPVGLVDMIAMRLRRETTLTIKHIASRLSLGTPKSASTRLREWQIAHPDPTHPVHSPAE